MTTTASESLKPCPPSDIVQRVRALFDSGKPEKLTWAMVDELIELIELVEHQQSNIDNMHVELDDLRRTSSRKAAMLEAAEIAMREGDKAGLNVSERAIAYGIFDRIRAAAGEKEGT